jgi:hypothetical protein
VLPSTIRLIAHIPIRLVAHIPIRLIAHIPEHDGLHDGLFRIGAHNANLTSPGSAQSQHGSRQPTMHWIRVISVPEPRLCDVTANTPSARLPNIEKSLARTSVRCNSYIGSLNYKRKEQTGGVDVYVDRLGF